MKDKFKTWIKPFMWAIIAVLIARMFIQSYGITDNRMQNTLNKGDYIIINRCAYGLRLPITLFSLPLNDNKIPFTNIPSYVIITTLPYIRIGTSTPSRLDIIAYNSPLATDFPIDLRPLQISRVIGLPGDTVTISNKKVFVNNIMVDTALNNLVFEYRIVTDGTYIPKSILDSMNINGKMISDIGIYNLYMLPSQVSFFEHLPYVKMIREVINYKGYEAQKYFPVNSHFFGWDRDYFGPLIVPYKGQTVPITFKDIDLYKDIIRNEGNEVDINIYKKEVKINGEKVDFYTIKKNYYFVLDDNRDQAFDSRYIGFIPEDHIVGKGEFIWFSINKKNNKSDVVWNKMLKKIK